MESVEKAGLFRCRESNPVPSCRSKYGHPPAHSCSIFQHRHGASLGGAWREALDDLDEAAQRKLDSWAFGVYERESTEEESEQEALPLSICCVELVSKTNQVDGERTEAMETGVEGETGMGDGDGGDVDGGGFSGAPLTAISGGLKREVGPGPPTLARMSVREQMAVPNFWWPTLRRYCVVQPTNSPPLTLEALCGAATCMADFSDRTARLDCPWYAASSSWNRAPTPAIFATTTPPPPTRHHHHHHYPPTHPPHHPLRARHRDTHEIG